MHGNKILTVVNAQSKQKADAIRGNTETLSARKGGEVGSIKSERYKLR